MNPKLAKWLRWMPVVMDEIRELVIARSTFHAIQSMIHDNPKLHQHSSFYDYLARTYVSHVVAGVRRQIKSDGQSISVARLLEEMTESPDALPRTYYTDKYKGTVVERLADKDFESFADPSAPHISAAKVTDDLNQLRKASAMCEDYADKRIAHRDKREPKELPTFNDLDECVTLLDSIYVKYHRLYYGGSMNTLLPPRPYGWTAIFRVPWLPEANEEI